MNYAQFTLFRPVSILGLAFVVLSAFSLCQNSKSTTLLQSQQTKVDADDIVGVWHPKDGEYNIEIFKSDGEYKGKIVWLKDSKDEKGKPRVDKLNPQRNLRNQPVLGLVNVTEFEFNAVDEVWEDGFIYDPSTGETMKGTIQLLDTNTVEISGFMGFSLSEVKITWQRV